jgi:hypothetical protein
MNPSRGQATSVPARPETAWWKRLLIGGAVVLALAFLFAAPFVRYGAVVGEEFSPDDFHRRSYHYWEIPLVHVQVTPLRTQDETNDLERHLVQNKVIARRKSAKPRWDLVSVRRGESEAPPGDAAILCRYLDQTTEEGDLIWLAWTKKEPQLAAVLWPAVAEAARRELHLLTPDLFHLAQQAASADELKQSLARHLAARYEQLARVQQQLGNDDVAAEWFKAARHYEQARSSAAQGSNASPPATGPKAEAEAPTP